MKRTIRATCVTFGLLNVFLARAGDVAPPVRLGELALLFPDKTHLRSCQGATFTVHPARTLSKPVLRADRPWERGRVYVYGNVIWDPNAQRFAMWYSTPKPSAMLFAVSGDGLTWGKPEISDRTATSLSRNNVVLAGVHSPSVLYDATDTDPKKRFKMMGKAEDGYITAFSGDGVHWRENPRSDSLPHGDDTLVLSTSPGTGEYLCYHKALLFIRGYERRVVCLSRSRDFLEWSKPELVFAADENDDAWTGPGQRTDVYNMSVYPHAGGFLGFPTLFRVTQSRPPEELGPQQSPDDGNIDVQLVTSGDGRHWKRVMPGTNLIPRGPEGSFDHGAILGLASQQVPYGDKTWIYYTGVSTSHGAPVPPKEIAIGRAEWRRDGFVSLDAEGGPALIETVAFEFVHPFLICNADASKGRLRLGLRELDGATVDGFGLEDCVPLKEDETTHLVRWTGGSRIPLDRPLRVVVEMSPGARLFSLSTLPGSPDRPPLPQRRNRRGRADGKSGLRRGARRLPR